MSRFKKLLLGLVSAAVLALGLAVSPASAAVPVTGKLGVNENTNVPFVAWRGEHVRLGFCVSDALASAAGTTTNGLNASWHVEDWSGDPANGSIPVPFELVGTAQMHGNCYYTAFTSQKVGIAFIKLTLNDPVSHNNIYHQFLVIWLNIDHVSAQIVGSSNVDPAEFCRLDRELAPKTGILPTIGFPVCDPTIDPRHRVNVVVTGTAPLAANFSELGLGPTLHLPADWAALAGKLATCSATIPTVQTTCTTPAAALTTWDIHDDSATTEGHIPTGGNQCDTIDETNVPPNITDAVDNCRVPEVKTLAQTGAQAGPFSTVFGTPTQQDTWGPFDPMFPLQTLLSDGKLDAGDAPMPAARIDVTIRENNAANPADISGVGYLFPSYKTEIYSRDGKGSDWWGNITQPVKPHNFYAPYYSQYIPATARPADGNVLPTGVDGGGAAGFNGFLNQDPLYRNWDIAWTHSYHPDAASKCLYQQAYLPWYQVYRPLPYGPNSVAVYSDEAGEANINFIPSLGMYFDNVGANKNLNMGCDLEGVGSLGTATLDIAALYPYQEVTAQPVLADPVTFTVGNLFHKTLATYDKGVDAHGIPSNSVAKIVLAHAQDIDGSPLAGEIVCWMADANAAGMRAYVGSLPDPNDPTKTFDIGTIQAWFSAKDPWGLNRLCTYTNLEGNTAIEIYNSRGTDVDVIAEFVNEGILRDKLVSFTPGSLGSQTPTLETPPTAVVPTQAQIKSAGAIGVAGPVVLKATPQAVKTIKSKQAKAKKVLHKIRFAKVVTPFHGKAKLQVRVNGKAGMVKLRITMKKGKKTRVFTRFVPANKTFAVKNLAIPAKTTKITVKLIGI